MQLRSISQVPPREKPQNSAFWLLQTETSNCTHAQNASQRGFFRFSSALQMRIPWVGPANFCAFITPARLRGADGTGGPNSRFAVGCWASQTERQTHEASSDRSRGIGHGLGDPCPSADEHNRAGASAQRKCSHDYAGPDTRWSGGYSDGRSHGRFATGSAAERRCEWQRTYCDPRLSSTWHAPRVPYPLAAWPPRASLLDPPSVNGSRGLVTTGSRRLLRSRAGSTFSILALSGARSAWLPVIGIGFLVLGRLTQVSVGLVSHLTVMLARPARLVLRHHWSFIRAFAEPLLA